LNYKDTQRINQIYRKELIRKATNTERIVKDWFDDNKVYYKFQKGFLIPFHRIVDFYLPSHGLILEIDGYSHLSSKNSDDTKDKRWAEERGMKTIRILTSEVWSGSFKNKLSFLLEK
jgi:very-short-patch-repair endonuclease